MDVISWVCAYSQEDHDWISEFSLALQETTILEASNYDTDVPDVGQWGMLWFPAPTSVNNDLRNTMKRSTWQSKDLPFFPFGEGTHREPAF